MTEAQLTLQVADYLRLQFPNAPYHIDYGSGTKLTIGQARRQARLNQRGFPDVFICVPRFGWHGLFIELKIPGTSINKRNGELVGNPHIREQAAMLDRLNALGYKAVFGIGFDECAEIISSYLTQVPKPPDSQ
jgi:hypothetical protein